jgi:hypothetical protein
MTPRRTLRGVLNSCVTTPDGMIGGSTMVMPASPEPG